MPSTAVLKRPLRTKAVLGPEPVLPITSEQSVIPPGMRCVIILVEGRAYMVFPSELEWATGVTATHTKQDRHNHEPEEQTGKTVRDRAPQCSCMFMQNRVISNLEVLFAPKKAHESQLPIKLPKRIERVSLIHENS